jgi:hypothetical protein
LSSDYGLAMARLRIRYRLQAVEEMEQAADWYRARDARATQRLLDAIRKGISDVLDRPHSWPADADNVRVRRWRHSPTQSCFANIDRSSKLSHLRTPVVNLDIGAGGWTTRSELMDPSMVDLSRMEVPDDAIVDVLRRLTPAERLAIANGMWVSARQVVGFVVRRNHPDWSDEQVQHEIVRRMLHGAV